VTWRLYIEAYLERPVVSWVIICLSMTFIGQYEILNTTNSTKMERFMQSSVFTILMQKLYYLGAHYFKLCWPGKQGSEPLLLVAQRHPAVD
jgi:hypothetical protein